MPIHRKYLPRRCVSRENGDSACEKVDLFRTLCTSRILATDWSVEAARKEKKGKGMESFARVAPRGPHDRISGGGASNVPG